MDFGQLNSFETTLADVNNFFAKVITHDPRVNKKHRAILKGMTTQLKNGLGLTEKQYNLAKEILGEYQSLFAQEGHPEFNTGRLAPVDEFRVVNKVKCVVVKDWGIQNTQNCPFTAGQRVIDVYFPYKQTTIDLVNSLQLTFRQNPELSGFKYYKNDNHHYFSYDEYVLYKIVDTLKSKTSGFELCDISSSNFEKYKAVEQQPHMHLPSVVNNEIFIDDKLLSVVKKDIGDENFLLKLVDRHRRYGIHVAQNMLEADDLTTQIVSREASQVFVNSSEVEFSQLVASLQTLDRKKILCVLDTYTATETIAEYHQVFSKIFDVTAQACLSRLDDNDRVSNKNYQEFNKFVKDNKLNNWVDINTNIVYITSNSFPKILMKSGWKPNTVIRNSCRAHHKTTAYIKFNCDLIAIYDNKPLLFK